MATTVKPKPPKEPLQKRKIADAVTPPGATSATTPLGIKANDRSAVEAWAPDALKVLAAKVLLRERPQVREIVKGQLTSATAGERIFDQCHPWQCTLEAGPNFSSGIIGIYATDGFGKSIGNFSYEEIAEEITRQLKLGGSPDKEQKPVTKLDRLKETADVFGAASDALKHSGQSAQAPKPVEHISANVQVEIAMIERHPINRHPAAADVAERAKSLAEDGQLEDCVVRRLGVKRFQMISGETRLLAAKSLGWSQLRCTVIECDDAEAARRVALHNAQRKDLNTIEKAQLVEALCQPPHGCTREQAAKHVGLESASAASNLVRLLKLPKVWQERIASGELRESFARLLVPVIDVPAALKELDEDYRTWLSGKGWQGDYWGNRQSLEDAIEDVVDENTTPITPSVLHRDEIEANREKLGIVTLTRRQGGKQIEEEVATNVKLFRELEEAARAKQATTKAKASGAEPEKPKPKSKAELERAAKERAGQLQRSIAEWRETLLRQEIAAAIRKLKPSSKPDPRLLKLTMHFMLDGTITGFYEVDDIVEKALGLKGSRGDVLTMLSEGLAKGGEPIAKLTEVAQAVCAALIVKADGTPGDAHLLDETWAELFIEWGCDFTARWQRLYTAKESMLTDFFEMHRKDELVKLGRELGVHLADNLGKPQMVKLLVNRPTPLPLPYCLCLQPEKKREAKSKPAKKAK